MKTCVYPGTFDPITNGHLDVLERACRMFDKVIVAVHTNDAKAPLFDIEERLEMVEKNISSNPTAVAMPFEGLLIDFAKSQNARVIIRGLRALTDFEYEFQMALMNRHLEEEVETIFVMTKAPYSFTSSSMVKQVSEHKGDVSSFVPSNVLAALESKYSI